MRLPAENDRILAALGAEPGRRPPARSALVVRTTAETALADRTRSRRAGPGPGRHRDRLPRPPARRSSRSTAVSTSRCSRAATSRWTSTTRSRTCSPRSATRSARRSTAAHGVTRYGSATVPMDEARATAAVDLVRRPHAEVDARVHAATASAASRSRCSRTRSSASRCRPACTLHVEAARRGRPPRRRGGVQGARPCAPRGVRGRGVRLDEGAAVIVLADYGAGNLRSVASALRARRRGARVTSDPPSRPRRAARRDRRRRQRRGGRARARERGLGAALLASASPPAARCSASASACSCSSSESEEGGRGLGVLPGRGPSGCRAARVPHMGWNDAPADRRRPRCSTASTAGRLLRAFVRAARPASRSPSPRSTTAAPVVAAVERGGVAGVQFHPERSGAAGAQILRNAVAWSRSA